MVQLFSDVPEAIKNSSEIAKRCTVRLELGRNFLPHFSTPNGVSADDYLTNLAQLGLTQRLNEMNLNNERRICYEERLQIELNVLKSMGFASYFLIVSISFPGQKEMIFPLAPDAALVQVFGGICFRHNWT